jgi:flagellar motor protein MotB
VKRPDAREQRGKSEPPPPVRPRRRAPEASHHGPPPWLMSYGDMMTLFLCFFIVLTTMADRQDDDLMAAGLGQFVSVLEHQGVLSGATESGSSLEAVNAYRTRFGLPELDSPGATPGGVDEIQALVEKELQPHAELPLPEVALFGADSADLSPRAKRYLDRIAETLRPRFGQVLVLEGHAADAGRRYDDDDTLLALSRALAVRGYLVERHEFVPQRVEARAWPVDLGSFGRGSNVDARLVEPIRPAAEKGES